MKIHRKSEPHNQEEHIAAKHRAPTTVQSTPTPVEPEEAALAGVSRSHQHRILRLNSEGRQAQRHPETPAGIHSTGSFTGENKKK
ncbi:MAG TPA: hypothetical protein VHT24_17195 [Pseudacidobacterium sp.]|jgi:hypothetical protein|nr:hypothetical protein [Pseudacidobacterium sp.]